MYIGNPNYEQEPSNVYDRILRAGAHNYLNNGCIKNYKQLYNLKCFKCKKVSKEFHYVCKGEACGNIYCEECAITVIRGDQKQCEYCALSESDNELEFN